MTFDDALIFLKQGAVLKCPGPVPIIGPVYYRWRDRLETSNNGLVWEHVPISACAVFKFTFSTRTTADWTEVVNKSIQEAIDD